MGAHMKSVSHGTGNRGENRPAGRITLCAGIGMVFGAAFGAAATGLVVGAALGLTGALGKGAD